MSEKVRSVEILGIIEFGQEMTLSHPKTVEA
jgi:hypothetical protein